MIYLSEKDIDGLVDMTTAIEAMTELLERTRKGYVSVIPRQRLEDGPMYMAMLASVDTDAHYFSAKLYTTGSQRGSFKLLIWSSLTGELVAVCDANRLGQLRTGAMSAVATNLLARQDAKTLLVVGTGYQAESQLIAISQIRDLATAYIYSRQLTNRDAFLSRMRQKLDARINLVAVDDVERFAPQSDIIVTATTSARPVLRGAWIRPGTHINAVGSNHPTDAEVDSVLLTRATVIATDHVEGARLESGDLIMGLQADEWSRVIPLEAVAPRENQEDITIFVSQGIESEDLILARYAINKWLRHQI